jgi:LmbE family N-acetylglucosaminyl deacetylase
LVANILVLAAHPDDAEIFSGGLLARHCRLGNAVRIVSVTDGGCGHQSIEPKQLVAIRRAEAEAAGQRIGASYVTWDFPDAGLEPNLQVRDAIIREIRSVAPTLVLTHRPYDYHPDHRACGIAVQDASYLVTVPHVCPEVPALRTAPVIAYMTDLFTRPCRMQADVLLNVGYEFDTVLQMVACHRSQVFEWLPHHDGIQVPDGEEQRLNWLAEWMFELYRARREHFAQELVAHRLPLEERLLVEAYEICEYARRPSPAELLQLFPGMLS